MPHGAVFRTHPETLSGTPVFVGTQVPVRTLLDYLEANDSLDEFLVDFPGVRRDQAVQFLDSPHDLPRAEATSAASRNRLRGAAVASALTGQRAFPRSDNPRSSFPQLGAKAVQTDGPMATFSGAPAQHLRRFVSFLQLPGVAMRIVRILFCVAASAAATACTRSPVMPDVTASPTVTIRKMIVDADSGSVLTQDVQTTRADTGELCSDTPPGQEQTCRGGGMVGGGW